MYHLFILALRLSFNESRFVDVTLPLFVDVTLPLFVDVTLSLFALLECVVH